MASSMTGFGRHEISDDSGKLTVEIRSVNQKYLDLNIKLGHRLAPFENRIRGIIREGVKRGKLDVSISYHMNAGAGEDVVYNKALAGMYVESINKISEEFGLVNDLTATRLATMRDVLSLSESEVDEKELWEKTETVLRCALSNFNSYRNEEGERLKSDLLAKLSAISGHVAWVEERCPAIVEEYKARLSKRLEDLFEDPKVDPNRIAMEVVLFADRIAIDEELVRLRCHVESFTSTLNGDGEMGRKLDFIAQEMNREANTILSKTQDPGISDRGIELKTLIEKIREQIQNLE